mmetsp:Transcript_13752/g.20763  ORF Transcript_13752/g.20763 Transcript_13752/m.20763 type:complete len:205 (-) Transcript_13752:191-805(-)
MASRLFATRLWRLGRAASWVRIERRIMSSDSKKPPFNFGPATEGDSILFGSCRPGYGDNEVDGAIKEEEVEGWISHMHDNGIKRVLSLLGDDEVKWYGFDLEQRMRDEFSSYTRVPMFQGDAKTALESAVTAAREAKEPIVLHCSGGGGRCGLGLAVAIGAGKGVALEKAKEEVEGHANVVGTKRKVDLKKLDKLVKSGNASGE